MQTVRELLTQLHNLLSTWLPERVEVTEAEILADLSYGRD